jgi:glycosyltransferase involved in cell wall biosynthesis
MGEKKRIKNLALIMQTGLSMSDTTVVIKTIGRDTIHAAFESAKREGFEVLVINDGCDMPLSWAKHGPRCKTVKLGKQWGYYGGMAANVGAALARTEFITFLDDDDEFAPGAGDVIRSKLKEKPDVDVWIGGVRFNQEINLNNTQTGETFLSSTDLAMNGQLGVVPGNVAMPTYRTRVFSKIPFSDSVAPQEANLTDFYHIRACVMGGCKLDWFNHLIYLVRPRAGGVNGEGR